MKYFKNYYTISVRAVPQKTKFVKYVFLRLFLYHIELLIFLYEIFKKNRKSVQYFFLHSFGFSKKIIFIFLQIICLHFWKRLKINFYIIFFIGLKPWVWRYECIFCKQYLVLRVILPPHTFNHPILTSWNNTIMQWFLYSFLLFNLTYSRTPFKPVE